MRYILVEYEHAQEDDPVRVYSEVDRDDLEKRRVEFYGNGLWFAYGEEHGGDEALSKTPFPAEVRSLNVPGEVTARTIPASVFREVWDQAAERPDGFMGMFF